MEDGRVEEDFLETNSPNYGRLSSGTYGYPGGYGEKVRVIS